MFINRGMNDEDVVYISVCLGGWVVEYYLAIKNETMSFAATWLDLQMKILSKVSQIENNKFHMILLYV